MSQPTLYLRATADRLIPANAPDIIAGLATKLVIRDIPAPHFMFQIDAGVCAEAIFDFIASL